MGFASEEEHQEPRPPPWDGSDEDLHPEASGLQLVDVDGGGIPPRSFQPPATGSTSPTAPAGDNFCRRSGWCLDRPTLLSHPVPAPHGSVRPVSSPSLAGVAGPTSALSSVFRKKGPDSPPGTCQGDMRGRASTEDAPQAPWPSGCPDARTCLSQLCASPSPPSLRCWRGAPVGTAVAGSSSVSRLEAGTASKTFPTPTSLHPSSCSHPRLGPAGCPPGSVSPPPR